MYRYIYVVPVVCTTSKEKKREERYIVILTITPPPFGEMIVPIIKNFNHTNIEREKN